MKYFVLEKQEGNGVPEIVNWYEKLDVRRINRQQHRELPRIIMLDIKIWKEDMSIPGKVELSFKRFYNSIGIPEKSDADYAMGRGWRHNYELKLVDVEHGVKKVCLGDGRDNGFTGVYDPYFPTGPRPSLPGGMAGSVPGAFLL